MTWFIIISIILKLIMIHRHCKFLQTIFFFVVAGVWNSNLACIMVSANWVKFTRTYKLHLIKSKQFKWQKKIRCKVYVWLSRDKMCVNNWDIILEIILTNHAQSMAIFKFWYIERLLWLLIIHPRTKVAITPMIFAPLIYLIF